ncbi:MAG TPA: cytochrome c oxidase subunit 3 family protein [Candidatus Dormibacteraeota bacterium]|nr:cytochrome c oxidase subunit 3 family protein [Candidatus Dormibacteraeota bacterium]
MSEAATVHDANPTGFAHQFEDLEQQREAGRLGMWVFLATEVLFFGGMFAAYTVYRSLHPVAFDIGSHLLDVRFGATNTAVLICSSLTMALAIRSAQAGKKKGTIIWWLVLTIILGALFLFLKFRFEWYHDYLEHTIPGVGFHNLPQWGANAPQVQMFMCFYFFMTGLHALHMIVGIGVLAVLTGMAGRGKFTSQYFAPLEISGLYWHFVDIIWIFLFPLLYLAGGRYPH